MGIAFDHVQYVTDLRLILGEASSEISKAAPFTDAEFYRSQVDPGFSGAVSSIEGDFQFERYSSVTQSVGWKWQIRSTGQSAWTDVLADTESWGGYAATQKKAFLDSASLGANDDAPFQIRLIATAATAATVKVKIGTYVPSVRVIGESV